MNLYTINYIKSNPLIYQYLRANSFWYQKLNRNPLAIKEVFAEAKKYYKLTVPDKLDNFVKNIEMVSTFMDVFK